jgi:phage terminase large subunit-like protein
MKVVDYTHRIVDGEAGHELKAFASEGAAGLMGLNPACFICDELHAIGAALGERGVDIVHAVESGMLNRSEPLAVFITTAPQRIAAGIYKEVSDHAEAVIAGEVEDRRCLVLDFVVPPELDYREPGNWHYSNPGLGTTVTLDRLKEQHNVATARGADALAEFWSQNVNVEPRRRIEARADGFDMSAWDASERPELADVEALFDRSQYVAVGIDAGGARDLSSLVLLGVPQDAQAPYLVSAHCWLSRDGFDLIRNHTPVADFISAGELTIVDRVGDDLSAMLDVILDLYAREKLGAIGADPWGLPKLAENIKNAIGLDLVGVPQGVRIRPFLLAFQRDLAGWKIEHGGSSILRWCLSNVRFRSPSGRGLLLEKAGGHDGGDKIDAAVALLCAHAVRDQSSVPDVGAWIG